MLQEINEGVILDVKIIPKSSKNEIIGWENDLIKIKIKEIAEKGKANKELINFLSKTFNIAKSNIKIVKGDTSRIKRVEIKKISKAEILKILKPNE